MTLFYRIFVACFLVSGLSLTLMALPLRVYVALAEEKRIAVYRQLEDDGRLVFDSDIHVDGMPRVMEVSGDGRFLFASLSETGRVASFRIDGETGALSLLSEAETGSNAAFLHLDDSGRFLISASYRSNQVTIHSVRNGVLSNVALQTIDTGERPHSIELDPTNRFLFVSHTAANGIFQFDFDNSSGLAKPNEIPVLQREGIGGPRHFRFDRNGEFGYGSDEQGNSVTVYRLNSELGQLDVRQTLSTLPGEFAGKNTTSDVGIHPNGRFVYVANRGHDSLAAFSVDPNSGKLSFIDRFSCEANTRSFAFSPDGRFLYTAGSRSGNLAAYSVNEATGALLRFETFDVGKAPWWVSCVELPR